MTTINGLPDAIARDAARDNKIQAEGYTVLRIPPRVAFNSPAEAVRRVEEFRLRLRVVT